MADVPVPRAQLTPFEAAIPVAVQALLRELWNEGHAAYVVGGSPRDVVLGRVPGDWDLASNARPERVLELFPDAVYENAFGTVAVRREGVDMQLTTFRSDHDYADFRRPHRVEFGDTIELDLARRDFTINAMAWGARPGESPGLVDPYNGLADIEARVLRAVGEPAARFHEDALRMVRAVRLATTLAFTIEPATLHAIRLEAPLVSHLSGERLAAELDKILAAPRPSVGLRLLADTGLLDALAPELARQRGIPQNKVEGEDLWDHTLRTVDATPSGRPVVRLAALLHDIGKPATFSEGHFLGHETEGGRLAGEWLDRLRSPKAIHERVTALVRQHMFSYEPNWSDAAVRRFLGKAAGLGPGALEELLLLREADNVGSGLPANAGRIDELRRRIADQLAADVALDRGDLAIDGEDLKQELGMPEGPRIGRILGELLERVIEEPTLNERPTLLLLARGMLADVP
jgi:tRNA nucleotidyltransferase/poly(A) polymerase